MASAFDESLKNITEAMKGRGMWANTLVLFLGDNGGDRTKNNFPLRGGKYSDFEGGIRTVGVLSGGAVPDHMRGQIISGYIHMADWYATFSKLAGADPSDDVPGVPPTDSLDMWPLLSNKTTRSPRTEIPLSSMHAPAGWSGGMQLTGPCIVPGRTFDRCSQGGLISGRWKLWFGPGGTSANETCYECWWSSPHYPNNSFPTLNASRYPPFRCPPGGCLFDIIADPYEYHECSAQFPEVVARLTRRLHEIQKTVWWSPGDFHFRSKQLCDQVEGTGGFAAPYQ